jgi:hypothetical protein
MVATTRATTTQATRTEGDVQHGGPPDGRPALRLVAGRRRSLPTGRALLGGMLVAIAVLGTFLLAGGDQEQGSPYVVVARPLPAGAVITADDLTTRRLVLDPVVAARSFTEPDDVVGAVALVPTGPGDLLSTGAVATGGVTGSRLELTLTVPEGRTPPALRRGETVTVLATLGTGADAATRPVLDAVEVVELTTTSGVAGRGETTLTVALADPALAVAGAHAARVGELTVVRLQGDVPGFGGTSTVELLGTGIAAGSATSEPLG